MILFFSVNLIIKFIPKIGVPNELSIELKENVCSNKMDQRFKCREFVSRLVSNYLRWDNVNQINYLRVVRFFVFYLASEIINCALCSIFFAININLKSGIVEFKNLNIHFYCKVREITTIVYFYSQIVFICSK